MKTRIFISYSRKDIQFVDRLEPALRERGIDPLIDRAEIYAFEDWWKRIETLIARADTIVFVLSPDAVVSEVALKEISHASSLNKRFAPIVCRRVLDSAVPESLRRLNFIFFDDPEQFETNVGRLVEALQADIAWIRDHTRFGEISREWMRAGRPNGLLLRSPVLESAERWIAARPTSAPAPTLETQNFISESRRGATRRRNLLTGSLATGLVVASVLAGLAYWQRGVAVEERGIAQKQRGIAEEQRNIAQQQRDSAIRNFKLAQGTAESLVFDIAQGLRTVEGLRAASVRRILETAKTTFEKLTTAAPEDRELQRSRGGMLDEFGDTYASVGDLPTALQMYRDGLATREALSKLEPENANWQRDVSISHIKIGDVEFAQNDFEEALQDYQLSLAISKRLATADAGGTSLSQRDLAVCYGKLASVLILQGHMDEALTALTKNIEIQESLVKAEPDRADWRRDLAISYEKAGDVLLRQKKIAEAMKMYRDSLAIRERLVALDAGNTDWQRDLSVAHAKVGDVLLRQGDPAGALQAYRDSLSIVEALASSDPDNTDWQRDVAIGYLSIGEILRAQGKIPDALQAYRDGASRFERLTQAYPGNLGWQHDLAIIYNVVGDVLEAQGSLPEALVEFESALAIRDHLAGADPGNISWQRDLAVSDLKIADLLSKQGQLTSALTSYRKSLEIQQAQLARDASDRQAQSAVRLLAERIGSLAYRFILDRDFKDALEAADQSISLASTTTWLYANRAHALMFLGRDAEARQIYLKFRGIDRVEGDKSWESVILDDFAELRNRKLVNPLMDEIEKLFAARG